MKKVLLYPCGGVGLVVSTVTRLASLKATEELLPGRLELLDMHRCQRGATDEIALLEKYPVVVLDGCRQQCGSYFLNCDYSLDIEEALAYDEINPRIHRPESMPLLPNLEKPQQAERQGQGEKDQR